MRVAYVMTHHPKQSTSFITDEIVALKARGCEVVPFAMNPPDAVDLEDPDARSHIDATEYLKSAGLRELTRSVAVVGLRRPIGLLRAARRAVGSAGTDPIRLARRVYHLVLAAHLARHCLERGVAHVHAQFGLAPATIAWLAATIVRTGDADRLTWSFTIHGFHDFVDEAEARLDRKGAEADAVVCVSDHTRAQLCRVTDPQHWHRFHVIRCGIDLDHFARRAPRSPGGIPVITVVARLSPEKGHLVLLDALDRMRRSEVAARLQIIGSGPAADLISAEAVRLGLESHVEIVGALPHREVAERLAESDVFCLPSFAEGLPVSIMEAMAIGVPVVCTAINGVPELAVDEVTALTVPPGNAGELASALIRVLTESGLGHRLGRNAELVVKERHDLHANAADLHELFRTVGSGGG